MQSSIARCVPHRGSMVPTFLYGTAWKEDRTQSLTEAALMCGFMGIDTANQRRHYFEAGVGRAVKTVLEQGRLRRSDLFLQTKYTYAADQDQRLPYDPQSDYASQVRQSLASSLDHLQTPYVDSLILHGPASPDGFDRADQEVWRTMEHLQGQGLTKLIGVSNIGYAQLVALLAFAETKPAFVQNRCFTRSRWDARIREVCRSNDIIYQGFSLLTANAAALHQEAMIVMARKLERTLPQIVFRFALQAGMIPLTGTTDRRHMHEDLAVYDFELGPSDMKKIETIAFS